MAQELSEKELLKMEVEQLKKEVKNPRALVSLLFHSLLRLLYPFLVLMETGRNRRCDEQQCVGTFPGQ